LWEEAALPKKPPNRDKPDAFELAGPMWAMHHAVARFPRSSKSSQGSKRLDEELAVRDVLTRYTYFYDGADVEGLLSVFHPDCTLINPRGTYVGHEAIRRNYAFLMSLSKFVLHFATNVIVRLSKDCSQAWMTAYYYSIAATHDGQLIGTGGTYADRLLKLRDGWKIIERRITYNFRNTLSPAPPVDQPTPPAPTKAQSSRDVLGPNVEM
jgi:ketosteroid isomerase-like protein